MKDAITRSLSLFFGPEDVFEVRGLDVGRPGAKVSGFVRGDSIAAMAGAIAELAGRAGGVYFTPQRLDPAALARSRHHLAEVRKRGDTLHPQPARDEDITARRFLIIDVDPVRPAEFKKCCATTEEKEAARQACNSIRRYLGQFFTAPLVVDSGNGFHLYYRLPADRPGGPVDSHSDPIATLLRTLKAKLDTRGANIDPSVFNASRIMKIPGTPARKGPDTPERPHRLSELLEVPDDWQ